MGASISCVSTSQAATWQLVCRLRDNQCPFDYTIFAWSDFHTGVVGEGCSNFASGCGVFTSVSGTAPNRIFNIEWRAVYFADHTQTANFEIRLV